MNTRQLLPWFVGVLALLLGSITWAAVPATMQFQGYLTDADGEALDGGYTISFTLYDAEEDGNAVWTEVVGAIIERGAFTAILGESNPLDANIFGSDALWLGIRVDDGEELSPRTPISSIPYAVRASVADNAMTEAQVQDIIDGGGYLTGYDETDPTVNALAKAVLNCQTNEVAKWDGAAWICAVDMSGLEAESDPVFSEAPAFGIGDTDIANWNACYGWGDHSEAGYLTGYTEIDPTVNALATAILDCENGAVARWNGAEWECSEDVDTDTLDALECEEGQVAKWDGEAWACSEDMDTQNTYSGEDFALSNQSCPDGMVANGFNSTGQIQCEADDNSTYSGEDFALSNQSCPDGMVANGFNSTGQIQCEADDNSTYSGEDFALSNQSCPDGMVANGFTSSGLIQCEADDNSTYSGEDFALSNQSCPDGMVANGFTSSGLIQCEADDNSTYSGEDFALSSQSCPDGMVASGFNSTGQIQCEEDDQGVVGSGTINYISKFTASTELGDSLVFDNGTSVGIGTATPEASAILDLSSTTQAFLLPRMTSTQRDAIASPVAGMMIFDTTIGNFMGYNGSDWRRLDNNPVVFLEEFNGSSGQFTTISYPFGDPLVCGNPNLVQFANNGTEEQVSLGCYDEAELTATLNLPVGEYTITVTWRTGADGHTYTSCNHTTFDDNYGSGCVTPSRLIVINDSVVSEVSGLKTNYSESTVVNYTGAITTLKLATSSAGNTVVFNTYYDSVKIEQ